MSTVEVRSRYSQDGGRIIAIFPRLGEFAVEPVQNDNVARMGESLDMALIRSFLEREGRGVEADPLYAMAKELFRKSPGRAYTR